MNEQASILFNMSFSFSGDSAGKVDLSSPPFHLQRSLYSLLARSLYTREGFEVLGRQLAAIARHAYFARQMDTVEQASQLMLALPLLKEQRAVALYYQAICDWNRERADETRLKLEELIEVTSPNYQPQGLLTVGAIYHIQGKPEAALSHYLAAARAAGGRDLLTFAAAQKMTAVIRSIYGDHQRALDNLERIFPSVRAIAKYSPAFYFEFLNSYAIELGEVGRLNEAQNVCAITLASPFASAYPEFAQTRDELADRRTAATPSIIAVPAAAAEISDAAQAQIEPEPEPARARSTITLKLRRFALPARALTMALRCAFIPLVSTPLILDRLAESILPRGPPVLS